MYYEALNKYLASGNSAEGLSLVIDQLRKCPNDVISKSLLTRLLDESDVSFNSSESVIPRLERFYYNLNRPIIERAARGWQYTVHLDNQFILQDRSELYSQPQPQDFTSIKSPNLAFQGGGGKPESLPDDLLDKLSNNPDARTLYPLLKHISTEFSEEFHSDDYTRELGDHAFWDQLTRNLSNKKLNVIILGGGPVGLFFAHCLTRTYGRKVSVIVVDNRIQKNGFRQPYSRDWLTHLPISLFNGVIDQRILGIFRNVGDEGFIGVPINVLETLLLMANKVSGTRFVYRDDLELSSLRHLDLIFDATGGRIKWRECSEGLGQKIDVVLPRRQNYGGGFSEFCITDDSDSQALILKLKPQGDFLIPNLEGQPITTPMLKITNLPYQLADGFQKEIELINQDSKFYLWPGKLNQAINQHLLIINLPQRLYHRLNSDLKEVVSVDDLLRRYSGFLANNDPRLSTVLNKISGFTNLALVEPPFLFDPRIRISSERCQYSVAGTPVFFLGDSLFNGHPKVGNGLLAHLEVASALCNELVYCLES